MLVKKQTALESIDADVKAILNWKLEQLTNENLPVESGIADYVHFGMSNIDSKIEQLKNYKKAIEKEINEIESFKATTSENISEWMYEQGIDKLNGLECSSITINKGCEQSEEIKSYKVFITELTKEQIEELVIENGFGYYETTEKVEIKPATKDKIRINSRRK